jgi:hypothetical protein
MYVCVSNIDHFNFLMYDLAKIVHKLWESEED